MQRLVYFTAHFLFWTTFSALSWMSVKSSPGEFLFLQNNPAAIAGLFMLAGGNFYTFYFLIQPKLFDTKRYVVYFLVSIGFSVIITALFIGVLWISYPSFQPYALLKLLEGSVGSFIIGQCGSLLRGFISWNQNIQLQTSLENKSLRNELAMLKAQLSPHFLFNTLNNIDALIFKSQQEASSMLIKLSNLLRYMLYESDGKDVPVDKEIAYIEELVNLQRLRFKEDNFIALDIRQDNSDLSIAPLIFLPFIENAFKFVSKPTQMPAVKIGLETKDQRVTFKCVNQFDQNMAQHDQTGGIGLQNAKRRLELMYKDHFDLEVSKDNSTFSVKLEIDLS